jgi:hypothetical protein
MKTMTMVATALLASAALAQDSARDEAVRRLSTMKVSVDFDKLRLQDALDYLRDFSGINIVVTPSAQAKEGDATVSLKAKDLSVKSVLKLMLHGRGLTATFRDGVLVVLPLEELSNATVLRIYDVRSHLLTIQDHPGPRVELTSATGPGGPLPGAVFELNEPKPLMEPDFLVDLVKANTGGRSWEGNPNASINLADGRLVVTQSPGVHAEIESFLRRVAGYR